MREDTQHARENTACERTHSMHVLYTCSAIAGHTACMCCTPAMREQDTQHECVVHLQCEIRTHSMHVLYTCNARAGHTACMCCTPVMREPDTQHACVVHLQKVILCTVLAINRTIFLFDQQYVDSWMYGILI